MFSYRNISKASSLDNFGSSYVHYVETLRSKWLQVVQSANTNFKSGENLVFLLQEGGKVELFWFGNCTEQQRRYISEKLFPSLHRTAGSATGFVFFGIFASAAIVFLAHFFLRYFPVLRGAAFISTFISLSPRSFRAGSATSRRSKQSPKPIYCISPDLMLHLAGGTG